MRSGKKNSVQALKTGPTCAKNWRANWRSHFFATSANGVCPRIVRFQPLPSVLRVSLLFLLLLFLLLLCVCLCVFREKEKNQRGSGQTLPRPLGLLRAAGTSNLATERKVFTPSSTNNRELCQKKKGDATRPAHLVPSLSPPVCVCVCE
jgi:hypothetical protein